MRRAIILNAAKRGIGRPRRDVNEQQQRSCCNAVAPTHDCRFLDGFRGADEQKGTPPGPQVRRGLWLMTI